MGSTYTFVRSNNRKYEIYDNKEIQELLMKWSMKHQLKIQSYSFNEPFQIYMKNKFVDSFFKHPEIVNSLQGFNNSWQPVGVAATRVKVELVPCSVLSIAFFSSLTDPKNEIVTPQGSIKKCYYEAIDGFDVYDELRQVLLNKESDKYKLFSPSDRSQFIFRLFQALCLGGKWCQYEDNIQPYLDTTKVIYKDLIRVQKNSNTKQVYVTSVVLKVIAEDANGYAYFPQDPENIQNFAYLIVDPIQREVITLTHQFGGYFDDVA